MKKKITKLFCTIIFPLVIISSLNAQSELIFKHITMNDGLPDDGVEWVIQDHLGFIWIATRIGLVKYDGYEFIQYKSGDKNSVGLEQDRLRVIYEDSRGDIWAGSDGYLNRYIRTKDTLITYKSDPNKINSLKGEGVYSIIEDSKGTLWIGNYRGWINFVEKAELDSKNIDIKFHQFKELDHEETYIVFNLFEDKKGVIWACTRNGLLKISDGNIEVIQAVKSKDYNRNNTFFTILQENNNEYWIGTYGNGLANYNDSLKSFEYYPFKHSNFERYSSNNILSLLIDSKNNLWCGTQGATAGGLLQFDKESKTYRAYFHNNKINTSIIDGAYFHNIFEDNSGTIWLPAFQKGITRMDPSLNQIEQYYYTTKNNINIGPEIILCFFEASNGNIWVGTNNGIMKYNPLNKNFEKVKYIDNSICSNKNTVTKITEDINGNIWFITGWNGELRNYNVKNNIINCYKHSLSGNGLSNPYLTGIESDKDGMIWVSTYGGGLNRYNTKTNKFSVFKIAGNESKKDDPEEINKMCEDINGNLWLASYDRTLNIFNKESETFTRIPFSEIGGGFNTTGMLIDSQNRLWLATRQGGIVLYNIESGGIMKFTTEDGLPTNDLIYDFFEDKNNNIYCRTRKELLKFSSDGQFDRFYTFNIGANFLIGAYYVKKTNEIFLTTNEQLIKFYPESITLNKTPPQMVLTDFKFYDKSLKMELTNSENIHANILKVVELEHYQNDFTIKFVALHYTKPEDNRYKYILHNYDEKWHETTHNRIAKFTNLSYGKYLFEVLGANCDGIWTNKPATLEIIINPPWWLTWWAYTIYAILILSIITIVWILQMRRIQIKNELKMKEFEAAKLKEVDQMKSNFFANISHEFRTPLTLIKGPIERMIYDEKKTERKEVYKMILKNTKKLLLLINELLDLSKLEAGKMKLCVGKYDIVSFTKGVVMSFKSLAESKEIFLSVKTDKNYIQLYFDKEKMQKIISNLISNALKFTPERGIIKVSISENISNNLIIEISDTGIGIQEKEMPKLFDRFYQVIRHGSNENIGTGIGLALTKELVLMHKGTITVKSEYGKGSTFIINMPLGKDHLTENEIIINEGQQIQYESIENLNIDELKNNEKHKPLLLIVEDDLDVLKFIKDILNKEYHIICANNGEEGYQKCLEHIPDLILSDIMMPVLDGNRMCEKIRKDEKTSHIPIILLTAKADEENKIEGLELGADDYIIKPFDPLELVVRIKNLILLRNKLRTKYLKEAEINPKEVAVYSVDKKFIEKAINFVEEHLDDEKLSVEEFADNMAMSRTQLYRKFIGVLGVKPNEFIRNYRIKRAAELIKQNFGNIAQVAFEVGFNDPAYFAKCFRKVYKINPFEFEKKYKQKKEYNTK
ncbi:MAG: response regulator [Ignavibacteriales bacterium]|nr:response regulator [Ignavibacteriales bacterium]